MSQEDEHDYDVTEYAKPRRTVRDPRAAPPLIREQVRAMADPVQPTGPSAFFCTNLCPHRPASDDRNYCPDCGWYRCFHCGSWGPPGEDHTCTCPKHDNDCTEHKP